MTVGFDLVIRAPRAICRGAEMPATIGVRAGRIAAVGPLEHTAAAQNVIELTDREVLLPGLADSHVHICEPGHADWEGFATATMAAAAGGMPAQLASLRKKGRIAPGYDADFCIFAPDDPFLVDPAMICHKHPLTPYADRTLTGTVSASILRGELIDLARPRGELLRRDPK